MAIWYTQDPRPVTSPVAVALGKMNPEGEVIESMLLAVSFYGKCSKDAPPDAATPYTAIYIDQDSGMCKPVEQKVQEEGWTVLQWSF